MDIFNNIILGFSVAATPANLFYCLVGALVGSLIGVLPGLGPIATLSMLLPITFYLEPTSALIMLAGIYYGAQYGGSTTAILVNMPGESSSVVTCIDGYQMARKGRAGPALAVAALGSLFAGCVSTLLLALFAPPLTKVALMFGPAEYFALMCLGLVAAIVLARGDLVKALAMIALGLLLGLVGTDLTTGQPRMTLGIPELTDGISFVTLAMGLFAISEILINIESPEQRGVISGKVSGLWPTRDDFRRATPAVLRGTGLGSVLGILPGGGAMLASFASYAVEKRVSRRADEFGHGAVEGVAGPEAANNAGAQMSFVPLLTLGIPSNAVMALMAGAMILQGIQPGPRVMMSEPSLVWGLIASMWIGNVMLVIINLPLIAVWVALLKVNYRILYPLILVLCFIGVYAINRSQFEVMLLALFGLLGYALRKWRCEASPLLLAFILAPMIEENLRRALLLAHGDFTVFLSRPISLSLLGAAIFLLSMALLPHVRRGRNRAFTDEA